jgi:O-phosphoseryl-tRNA(Cys) synthetase
VLFDYTGIRYGEPYSGLVFAELQDRDIPFVLDDEGLIRQFGEGRRDDGTAVLRMWQVEGAAAMEVPEGAERVAYADGLSPAERAEIAELDDQVRSGAIDGDDLQRWTALDERRRLHAVALLVEPV